jgi:hypothetical protein
MRKPYQMAVAVLSLAAALGLSFLLSAPRSSVGLALLKPSSNRADGNLTTFVVTNGTSREIDCGMAYMSIRVNGEWKPWHVTTVDVQVCKARGTRTFRLPPPVEGEAWRVKIRYIAVINWYERLLHRIDRAVKRQLLTELDTRRMHEAASTEIAR